VSKHDTIMRERYEARAGKKEPKQRNWYDDFGEVKKPKTQAPGGGAYKLIFMLPGGVVKFGYLDAAPKESFLLSRGQARRAAFVARYWPSKKGWRVVDIRQAKCVEVGGGGRKFPKWSGHRYLDTIFPGEVAATMAMWALVTA